jgi:excisionase family DNA binding protein
MSPTRSPKYSDWLTKSEAAAALECNEKTIERLAARKELKQGFRPLAGRRPAAVYDPADVNRLVEQKRSAALSSDAARAVVATEKKLPAPKPAMPAALEPSPVPIVQNMFLTLEEAAAYTVLPKGLVLRLVRKRALGAIKYGRWYIYRRDLEADLRHYIETVSLP